MTNRTHYSGDVNAYMVGVTSQAFALKNIEAALTKETNTPPTDPRDGQQRDRNIETLTALRDKVKANVDGMNARIAGDEKRAADDRAKREIDRKAEVMAELRRGFAGSDADFARLAESMYDNYLLNQPSAFDQALAAGRASGRYLS